MVTENESVIPDVHNKTFEQSINQDELIKLVDYLRNYLWIGLDGRENEAYRQKVLSLLIFDLKKTISKKILIKKKLLFNSLGHKVLMFSIKLIKITGIGTIN